MGNEKLESALMTAAINVFRPFIRILLRNGIAYGAFCELAKRIYVEVASVEYRINGRPKIGHISTTTGISRKEVGRICALPELDTAPKVKRHNRAAKVISAWANDPEYLDKRGSPLALSFNGDGVSFTSLVKRFSGDITARTILNELERVGAVTLLKDDRIKLVSRAYIDEGDDVEKVTILGNDVRDLINTIDHNITSDPDDTLFQRKVCYSNIPDEVFDELREIIVQKAQSALEDMDHEMAKRNQDGTKGEPSVGHNRTGIGIYYFKEPTKLIKRTHPEGEA